MNAPKLAISGPPKTSEKQRSLLSFGCTVAAKTTSNKQRRQETCSTKPYSKPHVCLDCFESKSKNTYVLYRNDFSTLKRHFITNHSKSHPKGQTPTPKKEILSLLNILPYQDKKVPEEARREVMKRYSAHLLGTKATVSQPSVSASCASITTDDASQASSEMEKTSQAPTSSQHTSLIHATQSHGTISSEPLPANLPNPTPPVVSVELTDVIEAGSMNSSSAQPPPTGNIDDFVNVETKSPLDSIKDSLRKLKMDMDVVKEHVGITKVSYSGKDIMTVHDSKEKWSSIKNLTDLISFIDCLELCSVEPEGHILRCKTCLAYHERNSNISREQSPLIVARMLNKATNCVSTGLLLPDEKLENLFLGKGQEWYSLKARVLRHMVGSDDGGIKHVKAHKAQSEKDASVQRQCNIASTHVYAAIDVIKSKSAAVHFEDRICFAHLVGGNVGGMGHGRKQFPELMDVIEHVVDKRIKLHLERPVDATKFPPHFWITVDKATVHRQTSQAVMIVFMVNGVRQAVPVSAPVVYFTSQASGGVEGGSAPQLALAALREVKMHYGESVLCRISGKIFHISRALNFILNQNLSYRSCRRRSISGQRLCFHLPL